MKYLRHGVVALCVAAMLTTTTVQPARAIPCPAFPVPVYSLSEIGKALSILERIRGLLNGSYTISLNIEDIAKAAGAPGWMVNTAARIASGEPLSSIAWSVASPFVEQYIAQGIDFASAEFSRHLQKLAEIGIPVSLADLELTARMAEAVQTQNYGVLMGHPWLSPYVTSMEKVLNGATANLGEMLGRVSEDIANGVLDTALGFGEGVWDLANVDSLLSDLKDAGFNREAIEALLDSAKPAAEKIAELRDLMAAAPGAAIEWILAQDGLSLNLDLDPELQQAWAELLASPERLAALAAALGQQALNLVQWDELVAWFEAWEFNDQLAGVGLATATMGAISAIAGAVSAGYQGLLQHVCPEYQAQTEITWRTTNPNDAGLNNRPDTSASANALPVMPVTGALSPGRGLEETLDRRHLRQLIAVDRGAAALAMAAVVPGMEPELLEPEEECEDLSCETDFWLSVESQKLEQTLLELQIAIVRLQLEQAHLLSETNYDNRPTSPDENPQ